MVLIASAVRVSQGMYYYYHTHNQSNYQQTLVDVHRYASSIHVPYKYVLLDSWWYYRGDNGGVTNWTARPDVFPDGIQALYEQTNWLVQAHNRYWALETPYAKQNGGPYEFLLDAVRHGAVPTDPQFWDDLFAQPKAAWGLRVYEQDWLYNEFAVYVGAMTSDVHLARTWLSQMGGTHHAPRTPSSRRDSDFVFAPSALTPPLCLLVCARVAQRVRRATD